MMKDYRLERRLHVNDRDYYFPQYYVKPYFFGLLGGKYRDYKENYWDDEHLDMHRRIVKFTKIDDAWTFLENEKRKDLIKKTKGRTVHFYED